MTQSKSVSDNALLLAKTAVLAKHRHESFEKRGIDLNDVLQFVRNNPEIAGPVIGALGGAGVGALSSLARDEHERNMPGSALTGLMAGGLLGGGVGMAAKFGPRLARRMGNWGFDAPVKDPVNQAQAGGADAKQVQQLQQQLAEINTPQEIAELRQNNPALFKQKMEQAVAQPSVDTSVPWFMRADAKEPEVLSPEGLDIQSLPPELQAGARNALQETIRKPFYAEMPAWYDPTTAGSILAADVGQGAVRNIAGLGNMPSRSDRLLHGANAQREALEKQIKFLNEQHNLGNVTGTPKTPHPQNVGNTAQRMYYDALTDAGEGATNRATALANLKPTPGPRKLLDPRTWLFGAPGSFSPAQEADNALTQTALQAGDEALEIPGTMAGKLKQFGTGTMTARGAGIRAGVYGLLPLAVGMGRRKNYTVDRQNWRDAANQVGASIQEPY